MSKFIYFIINKHQVVVRAILIVLAVLLILFWLPEGGKFKYEFTKGKPWRYKDLIAPFDFAIQKSDEEIEEEKQQILADLKPFYRFDSTVIKEQLQAFNKQFNQRYHRVKKSVTDAEKEAVSKGVPDSLKHLQLGREVLQDILQKGLIELDKQHKDLDPTQKINFLRNNVAEKRTVKSFFTREKVVKWVQDSIQNVKGIDSYFLTPLIVSNLAVNVQYDEQTTEKIKKERLESVSATRGVVQEGEIIVSKGAIVTPAKYRILNSLKNKYEQTTGGIEKYYATMAGFLLLVCLSLSILLIYLYLFQKEIFQSTRKLTFLLFILVAMATLTGWVVKFGSPSVFIIPFCIVPILVRAFFDIRTAVYALISTLLITSLIVPNSFTFALLNLPAGMLAIFANVRLHYRTQFFISTVIILLTYFFAYTGLNLIQESDLQMIEWSNYGWLTINVLLTLLAYPLLPFFEKLFGLVSEVTLFELSDLNKPLLRELSVKAPGTFQHSLQVANLAEEASIETGGSPLLARVGALYHDIGKMENHIYFIENQSGGVNPHDELSFEESAKIIIGHVEKGVEKAKEYNLPEIIIDFIRTHHGTSRVEYFYQSFLKNYPKEFVDESKFRYPGPIPFSKETGIVMLADSVEAASRSLKNPEEADIDQLVERVIGGKIDQEQLVNADITFKEITKIKKLFKKRLKSIYHVRISYPEGA